MDIKKHSFADLEQQMAKDTLVQALKDLHGEIIHEIERNKKDFSENISKTLESFKTNLGQHISETIDQKMALHLEKNFQDINSQITHSFNQSFNPVIKKIETDMQELQEQGQKTLISWKEMMLNYKDLWTRPFFIMFSASILTGVILSWLSSSYLTRQMRETMKIQEDLLVSYKNLTLDYFEREKVRNKKKQ